MFFEDLKPKPQHRCSALLTYLHCAVLRGASNHVVVMGTPLHVKHRGCVAADSWGVLVNASTLKAKVTAFRFETLCVCMCVCVL